MRKFAFAALCAALALVSCNKNEVEPPVGPDAGTTITIKARAAETRTHIEGAKNGDQWTYKSYWDGTGESLGLFLIPGGISASDSPVELAGQKEGDEMVFHGSGFDFADGTYNMILFYPFTAFQACGDGSVELELKGAQNPVKGSFDPACDIMGFAEGGVVVSDGEATIEDVQLQRPMAILRVNLNAGEGDIAYGEVVKSLRIEAPEEVALTGRVVVNTENGRITRISWSTPENSVLAHLDPDDGITIGGADNSVYLVVAPATIDEGDELTVTIETTAHEGESAIVRTVTAPSDMHFMLGKVNTIDLKVRDCDIVEMRYAGGSGIEADPWLIATTQHMLNMVEDLVAGEKKYFKMIDDVDLDGVTWIPFNLNDPYNKAIDFNGNGKTISNLTSTGKYASFAGVLNGSVYNVTFDKANISSSAQKAGVLAGFLGSSATSVSADCHDVTVKNSTVNNTARHAGGLAGIAQVMSSDIVNCHVINTSVTGAGGNNVDSRAGGLFGEVVNPIKCSNCSAENVTVSGSRNVGGLIGVSYGILENCWSSGNISSPNTTANADIALGGLVGYFENGSISKCHSDANVNQSTNGRDLGGLVGLMHYGSIEKCYATGSVTGMQRNVGGLIGLVSLSTGSASISNCYCSGDVNANAYEGGLIGLCEKGTINIQNCYSASKVEATNFMAAGLVGIINAASVSMSYSAAWNPSVTSVNNGEANWSSGAVVGVAFPTCTLTGNYRNPGMALTAYWVPDAGFNHPDVSSTAPLTDSTGASMTDANTSSDQPHHPQYPYHGHVEGGKTLSQLASSTLGWSSDIWNFTGDLPTLK